MEGLLSARSSAVAFGTCHATTNVSGPVVVRIAKGLFIPEPCWLQARGMPGSGDKMRHALVAITTCRRSVTTFTHVSSFFVGCSGAVIAMTELGMLPVCGASFCISFCCLDLLLGITGRQLSPVTNCTFKPGVTSKRSAIDVQLI